MIALTKHVAERSPLGGERPYTIDSIARFLGWMVPSGRSLRSVASEKESCPRPFNFRTAHRTSGLSCSTHYHAFINRIKQESLAGRYKSFDTELPLDVRAELAQPRRPRILGRQKTTTLNAGAKWPLYL